MSERDDVLGHPVPMTREEWRRQRREKPGDKPEPDPLTAEVERPRLRRAVKWTIALTICAVAPTYGLQRWWPERVVARYDGRSADPPCRHDEDCAGGLVCKGVYEGPDANDFSICFRKDGYWERTCQPPGAPLDLHPTCAWDWRSGERAISVGSPLKARTSCTDARLCLP